MKTLPERLAQVMEQAQIKTKTALASAAGVSPPAVTQWFSGDTTELAIGPATRLAKLTGMNAIWISQGEGPQWARIEQGEESNAELAGIPRGSKPTPAVGEAVMGESGYFEQWGCHDGYVDGYSSTDPDAYALRVKGDSMQPAIRHGSFGVIEPNRRCVVGEYVAMALITGERMVKELVIERPNEVVIESVNGNRRRTIDRSQIETMHPVAAVVAASKWRA